MRILTLLILCFSFHMQLFAQKREHKVNLTILPELGVYANINKWDVKREGPTQMMRSEFAPGTSLGVGLRLENKQKILFFVPSIGVRLESQKLHLDDSQGLLDDLSFTNWYFYFKAVTGVSLPVRKANHIDLGIGLSLYYSLKNEELPYSLKYTDYTDIQTGERLAYASTGYKVEWGSDLKNESSILPCVMNLIFQTAYLNCTWLPNNRMVRLGLEFSVGLISERSGNTGNNANMETFDINRNIVARERFVDQYTNIGVNFGIGI